jgi:cobalt-zinc-cadmium efflux system membrane fusion protein
LGYPAQVSVLSYPDTTFNGEVDKIFNVIDPITQAMKIRIKLANKDYKLKPEMRAHITLAFDEDSYMLSVPSDAIIFDNNKTYVMIYQSKKQIETREIEVFRQVGNTAFISAGLKKNERIITHNQLLIYDALND